MSLKKLSFVKDLRLRHIVILGSLLVVSGILAESAQYLESFSLKRIVFPVFGILLVTVCLLPLAFVLKYRLLLVVNGNNAARMQDLFLIGFTYVSVIVGFGEVYQLLESAAGKEVFAFSPFRAQIHLIDNVYVSGITMATVGFGDIVPIFWFTKLLVVTESLIGILLTATVLGFFIGSLLSSQQQDQQKRWYAGLQRRYLQALYDYSLAINSIDRSIDIAELKKKTMDIR